MHIRQAALEDVPAIAAAFPLPKEMIASEEVYRSYFEAKALIYVRAPCASITCGFVDGQLAGYQFYTESLTALRRYMTSPRNVLWLIGQTIAGYFGYSPSFWLAAFRWGIQHFRQPKEYHDSNEHVLRECGRIETWSRGVRTVDNLQHLGVASRLMRHTEKELQRRGVKRIALWTAADNAPAIGLFEKMGFRRSGKMRRIGETCWLMVKDLSASSSG